MDPASASASGSASPGKAVAQSSTMGIQHIVMSLPPELLETIAAYVHPTSLPACCLVCKAWLPWFRARLWYAFSLTDMTTPKVLNQFQHHYNHIRRLLVVVPCETAVGDNLLGATVFTTYKREANSEPGTARHQQERKTLLDCNRVEAYAVNFVIDELCFREEERAHSRVQVQAALKILENNSAHLRELKVGGVSDPHKTHILKQLAQMPALESLSLDRLFFGYNNRVNIDDLLMILKQSGPTLKCLELEGQDLERYDGRLVQLQQWREEYDCQQAVDKNFKTSGNGNGKPPLTAPSSSSLSAAAATVAAAGATSSKAADSPKLQLTRIRTLILDRSTFDGTILVRLAGVMPELREISLRGTTSLAINDTDDLSGDDYTDGTVSQDEEDFDDDDDDESVPSAEDISTDDGANNEDEEDLWESEDSEDDLDSNSDAADVAAPKAIGAHKVDPVDLHAEDDVIDSDYGADDYDANDYDDYDANDYDDYDANDYDANDYDYDHIYDNEYDNEDNFVDDYDDDADFDAEDYVTGAGGAFPMFGAGGLFHSIQSAVENAFLGTAANPVNKTMISLHKRCPLIEVFDFSDNERDNLSDAFFTLVCKLWGGVTKPKSSTSKRLPKSSTPLPPHSGLKALRAQNVRQLKPSFFHSVLRHCQKDILTELDFSMGADYRSAALDAGARLETPAYNDGILNIMQSCPSLVRLHLEPYPINARSIVKQKTDWVCTKLISLRLCIEFDPPTKPSPAKAKASKATPAKAPKAKSTKTKFARVQSVKVQSAKPKVTKASVKSDDDGWEDDDEEAEIIQIRTKVFQQLGRLTRLEVLILEGGRALPPSQESVFNNMGRARTAPKAPTVKRQYLELSLESGLDYLAPLEKLAYLNVLQLGPHSLQQEPEMKWLENHWPELKKLIGFWDQDKLRKLILEQKKTLDPRPSLLMAAPQVRLRLELDLMLDPKAIRLSKRGIQTDSLLVESLMLREGLETVGVLEKGGRHVLHGPKGVDADGNEVEEETTFSWFVKYNREHQIFRTAGW
ncbi:hypothetical protein BG011_006386 [Mortierella polycephala]|uniref:F-box domain-containing protein n=1 Tax=Mortierella polycephala TaxID=41804 RepID=A0A9P6PUY3_9FUNG|nr:hypothetical protein BG011_006386 [Mortierella polycephala]